MVLHVQRVFTLQMETWKAANLNHGYKAYVTKMEFFVQLATQVCI